MKKTPLYDAHVNSGGKPVDFHSWLLPVQYTGIIEEHETVRSAAGLFDVSHMGEIEVKGPGAGDFVQRMITNDITNTIDGQVVYSPMCYPDGGTVDDLIACRYDANRYLLVVNASNTQKDYEWLCENLKENAEIINLSEEYAQLALQGPLAQSVLQKLTGYGLDGIGFFHFRSDVEIAEVRALVSRTGYTGEDGFEIYVSPADAVKLWDMLLEAGREAGVKPAGLGARDTLRFEAALPLYGQELSEKITPLEAGLDWFVKLDKKEFIGKSALKAQKEKGLDRKLTGFEMVDRGVPRSHYKVSVGGVNTGFVTSGGFCPSLKKNMGMGLLDAGYTKAGNEIDIFIRDKAIKAVTVKLPFYKKKYKK